MLVRMNETSLGVVLYLTVVFQTLIRIQWLFSDINVGVLISRVAEMELPFWPEAGIASRTGRLWLWLLTVKDYRYKPNFTKQDSYRYTLQSVCDFPFNIQSTKTQYFFLEKKFGLTLPLVSRGSGAGDAR